MGEGDEGFSEIEGVGDFLSTFAIYWCEAIFFKGYSWFHGLKLFRFGGEIRGEVTEVLKNYWLIRFRGRFGAQL